MPIQNDHSDPELSIEADTGGCLGCFLMLIAIPVAVLVIRAAWWIVASLWSAAFTSF